MSDYPNSGILFDNSNKTNPKAPDKQGTAEVGGVEYKIAAWEKTAKNGNLFLALKFTRKDEAFVKTAPFDRKAAAASDIIDDSDLPF